MKTQLIDSDSHLDSRVWTIAIALPNARQHTVAQFCNCQDAEDHLRVLRRFMPKAKFEIVFNLPM